MFELIHNFYENFEDIIPYEYEMKRGKEVKYYNLPSVFDIEVSSFINEKGDKQSLLYAFVFGINGKCVLGRTIKEFQNFLNILKEHLKIDIKNRFIIYVHNLSYEFQFLRYFFDWETVFSIDIGHPIRAVTKDGFEFRCSYLLSGYNLAKVGTQLIKYKVEKAVGDLDYSLIRTPETPLTEKEKGYILNDGLVVMAYIKEKMEEYEDDIAKLPYTKTGAVRKLTAKKCFKEENKKQYNNIMRALTLTPDEYKLVKDAFSGGFTHANINYVGKVLEDVSSIDFTSSYPAVMISEKFPMSKPFRRYVKSKNEFYELIDNFCCFFQLHLEDVEIKFDHEAYISASKCYGLEEPITDNGRVRYAKALTITVTELDYKIIEKVYDYSSWSIANFYCCYKGYLPKPIVEEVLELYEEKTKLKDVEGREYDYLQSKERLNSLYGMCVTDIVRDEIVYENGDWWTKEVDVEEAIIKYNNSYYRTLYYLWGVWISAYARYNLWLGIFEFREDYIYSDTDSIKCLNIEKHWDYINWYNERVTAKINNCLDFYNIDTSRARPTNIDGIAKPIGVWSFEGEYSYFKTLGAKRYISFVGDDFSITISGVAKKNGHDYLLYKYKTPKDILNAFTNHLLFPATYTYIDPETKEKTEKFATGKQTLIYLSADNSVIKGVVKDYLGAYYQYDEPSGLYMEPTSYDMNMEIEYLNQLSDGIGKGRVSLEKKRETI